MALRTFHFNPSLGGFGGESSATENVTPDAFCQIIKELVDNAVDACCFSTSAIDKRPKGSRSTPITGQVKRVRVVIERFQEYSNVADTSHVKSDRVVDSTNPNATICNTNRDDEKNEILRVTVTDNGCGMKDISKCVGAFHTSKAHARLGENNSDPRKPKTTINKATKKDFKEQNGSKIGSGPPAETGQGAQTAGRYGIGLTLCLLHAQRLVPNSCASIKSATALQDHWTNVLCVVDQSSDSIKCVLHHESSNSAPDNETFDQRNQVAPTKLKKAFPTECGTAISILVPGGPTSHLAWPRLSEYFARFNLSLGLQCSLEVLAPTLSRIPLFVSPPSIQINQRCHLNKLHKDRSRKSNDIVDDSESDSSNDKIISKVVDISSKGLSPTLRNRYSKDDDDRKMIWKAVQKYLGKSIAERNVATSEVPIRLGFADRSSTSLTKNFCSKRKKRSEGPIMKVNLIVQGPVDEDNTDGSDYYEDNDETAVKNPQLDKSTIYENAKSASMLMVRMVNNIPMLDSNEALACGLVHGVASKKRMWNAFGLDVNIAPAESGSREERQKIVTFDVRDSDQVAPYFKRGVHELMDNNDESYLSDDDFSSVSIEMSDVSEDEDSIKRPTPHRNTRTKGNKRRNLKKARQFMLPASLRLGNILIIAQICADPTILPLPSLSKGRLPMDNSDIDAALELAVTNCLKQLQTSNPALLLTASELKKAERDSRYVPAVASALSSIISRFTIPNDEVIQTVKQWCISSSESGVVQEGEPAKCSYEDSKSIHRSDSDQTYLIGRLIEERLRLVLACNDAGRKAHKTDLLAREGETAGIPLPFSSVAHITYVNENSDESQSKCKLFDEEGSGRKPYLQSTRNCHIADRDLESLESKTLRGVGYTLRVIDDKALVTTESDLEDWI